MGVLVYGSRGAAVPLGKRHGFTPAQKKSLVLVIRKLATRSSRRIAENGGEQCAA
jgi:hypothetical protein